jgi:raffinose/stachyose/melibiose transport system permease protein
MLPLAVLMRDIKLANTYMALIVPYIAFNLSFSSMVFYGFLRTVPAEIEESGFLDGAGIYRIFFNLIMPVLRPAVATMVIFVFLSSWNEFTMALILVTRENLKTLPLGLLFFQGEFTTNWGAMGAAMMTASVPTVIIYLLFSDQVEKALTVGSAVKG